MYTKQLGRYASNVNPFEHLHSRMYVLCSSKICIFIIYIVPGVLLVTLNL